MMHSIFSKLIRLSPLLRRFLLVAFDIFLIPISIWLSFWLRLAVPFHQSFLVVGSWLVPLAVISGIVLYFYTSQYQGLTRYVGSYSLYRLTLRNLILVLFLFGIGSLMNLPMPPRSSWFLLWVLLTVFTGGTRLALRDLLLSSRPIKQNQVRVAIYGAGEAGTQLAAGLRLAGNYNVFTFLDDSPSLWRRSINGIPIQPPQVLEKFSDRIDQILIAIPSISRKDRRRIISSLQHFSIPVLQIPSVHDLTTGRASINSLRPVVIEDLLGRDVVAPSDELLGLEISDSVVCVTGAGGSIGSELCRQILKLMPSHLILVDISEPALYAIENEVSKSCPESIQISSVLGNACNELLMTQLFIENAVNIVLHAAAYKHVPLVEANPLSGLENNICSTLSVCKASINANISKFILISTDKAVRPTNVMGASKRLAEMIVQAQSLETTKFSMVRFGNVLGSSGSVVPLFTSQIDSGGPITLTHPDIIRYFMTIPEAAQLVLQSLSLSEGGDLFLLDMGEPIRIKSLAEEMVRLSGLSIRDETNPGGEIELTYVGLRPGEKLYEELLISAESLPTRHPLIFRAKEDFLPLDTLLPLIDKLLELINSRDKLSTLNLLSRIVPEWKRFKEQ